MSNAADELTKRDMADILMKKYLAIRTELIVYLNNYKAHVKYVNFTLTVLIALFSAVIGEKIPVANSAVFWILVSLSVTTVIGYLVFDVLESQYALMAIAARAGVLEEMVNQLAKESLLIWETHMSDRFWTGKSPIKGVLHPDTILSIYMAILVIITLSSCVVYMFYEFWDQNGCNGAACWLIRPGMVIAAIYAAASGLIMVGASATTLYRMRNGARAFVRQVTNSRLTHPSVFTKL